MMKDGCIETGAIKGRVGEISGLQVNSVSKERMGVNAGVVRG